MEIFTLKGITREHGWPGLDRGWPGLNLGGQDTALLVHPRRLCVGRGAACGVLAGHDGPGIDSRSQRPRSHEHNILRAGNVGMEANVPGAGRVAWADVILGPHQKSQQLHQSKIPALRILREYRAGIYVFIITSTSPLV